MREIKFRAWNNRNKIMFEPVNLYNGFDCTSDWLEDCILMQYTGLKDKNGKEIYEGDICEVRYNNNTPTVNGVVEWFNLHTHFSIRTKEAGPYSISFNGSVVDGVYLV